jgi:hypothetical protein
MTILITIIFVVIILALTFRLGMGTQAIWICENFKKGEPVRVRTADFEWTTIKGKIIKVEKK